MLTAVGSDTANPKPCESGTTRLNTMYDMSNTDLTCMIIRAFVYVLILNVLHFGF